jgi:hypothetical protein
MLDFYDRRIFISKKIFIFMLKDKMVFQGSSSSASRILNHLGFKYKKSNNRHKFMMERIDSVAALLMFLCTMHLIWL